MLLQSWENQNFSTRDRAGIASREIQTVGGGGITQTRQHRQISNCAHQGLRAVLRALGSYSGGGPASAACMASATKTNARTSHRERSDRVFEAGMTSFLTDTREKKKSMYHYVGR